MVEADFSGDYLNVENCKDGDIGTILEEGSYNTKEFSGVTRLILDIPVEVNGIKKIYSPFKETGKKFIKAWGKETKDWKGKKFNISHVKYSSYGETKIKIEADPVDVKV